MRYMLVKEGFTKRGNGAHANQRVSVPLLKSTLPESCLITFSTWSVQKPRHNFYPLQIRGPSDTLCAVTRFSTPASPSIIDPVTKPQGTSLCTHLPLCQFAHTSTKYRRPSVQVACTQAPLKEWVDRCQRLWERSSDQEKCACSC